MHGEVHSVLGQMFDKGSDLIQSVTDALAAMQAPPVDLVALAAAVGLVVTFRPHLPPGIGAFTFHGPRWTEIVIAGDGASSNGLHRAKLAHELAAAILGVRWPIEDDGTLTQVQELEADLLLPSHLLEPAWREWRNVETIAMLFGAPIDVVDAQLDRLRLRSEAQT